MVLLGIATFASRWLCGECIGERTSKFDIVCRVLANAGQPTSVDNGTLEPCLSYTTTTAAYSNDHAASQSTRAAAQMSIPVKKSPTSKVLS
jgi:hypothetical protein